MTHIKSAAFDAWVGRARAVRIEDEAARRGVKLNGKTERCGACPACGGEDRFSINTKKQVWNCRSCGLGGDVIKLVEHLDGVDFVGACTALAGEPPPKARLRKSEPQKTVAEQYPYENASGVLAFVVERVEYRNPDDTYVLTKNGKRKKSFRQKRPDPAGDWIWNVEGVPALPYRLPRLIEALASKQAVVIAEGKRKVDLLWSWGVPATCCAKGANGWTSEHAQFLRGADVIILPDNDEAGRKHADAVAASLQGVAASVRVLGLPGLSPKGDVVDWAAAGGTAERLLALIEAAPDYAPAESSGEVSESPPVDDDAEIARLAKLSTLQYEKERKAASEKLGVRASILDRLVQAERGSTNDDQQGHAIDLSEAEPWPEPVDGPALLDEISSAIARYVIMPAHSDEIAALWAVHTYLVDRFLISPRLAIRSPTKQCGKTTLLDILARLVRRPLPTAHVTAAATFRVIESHCPCLLVDEGDTFLRDNEELRGILNSGHRQGGSVLRVEGDQREVRAFSTYCACAIAMIGQLPDTLADRSVAIDLKRRLPDERIEPFRLDRTAGLDELARKIARWAKDHGSAVGDPDIPSGLHNRAADNWRPLLAVADMAGGAWPARARAAAVAGMSSESGDVALIEVLLGDIRDVFDEQDRLSSEAIIKDLVEIMPRPWAEFGKSGKPISPNKLARLLKPLGIAPNAIWVGDKALKGYLASQFEDAFARFCPEGGSQPKDRKKRDGQRTSEPFQTEREEPDLSVAKDEKPNNDGLSFGLSVAKGGIGAEGVPAPTADATNGAAATDGAKGPTGEIGLSQRTIDTLATWYQDTYYERRDEPGIIAKLDRALRRRLREEYGGPAQFVPSQFVEIEAERVMARVFAVGVK